MKPLLVLICFSDYKFRVDYHSQKVGSGIIPCITRQYTNHQTMANCNGLLITYPQIITVKVTFDARVLVCPGEVGGGGVNTL